MLCGLMEMFLAVSRGYVERFHKGVLSGFILMKELSDFTWRWFLAVSHEEGFYRFHKEDGF